MGYRGEFSDIIANANRIGVYFVSVKASDFALSTACALQLVEQPPSDTPSAMPVPTVPPEPAATSPVDTSEPSSLQASTATPALSPEAGFGPGTYQVSRDIQPGIYAGKAGTGVLDSCYWERLSGVSGEFSDIIANGIAVGQFYIEVLSTDEYFKIGCDITSLDVMA